MRKWVFKNPKHRGIFKRRIKDLEALGETAGPMFSRLFLDKNHSPIDVTENHTNWKANILLAGEQLAENYFGFDMKVLVEIKEW